MRNKLLSILLFFCCALLFSFWSVQENTAPKVEITSPIKNVKLEWNTIVPYSISVSDKEDGDSGYDEINSNEVVLTVTYFSDSSKVEKYIDKTVSSRSEILSAMVSSNCFTCHKAKDKMIGPSFEEIAKRYSPTLKNKEYLAQKISKGSNGVWGDEIMPAQPELEKENIVKFLDWLFKNARDSNFTFYTGTEGAFRTREKLSDRQGKGIYVLHAQYFDHGMNESNEKSKKGNHSILLNMQ